MSTIQTGKIMHITLPVSLITQVNATQCPKQVIQKRKYLVYDTSQDLGEFNYTSLPVSHICPILIGDDIEGELPVRLATLQADIYFIITDDIVSTLYGNGLLEACLKQSLQTRLFSFPHGEKNKNFTTLNNLLCKILDCGITKKSVIVALGGGVVGNIAGLLANILMRGVRFVQAPTTVMHQADASTGGKQAVNTHHGKNLLGSFYEPEFIYNDITCINTLPQRDYNNGIAEIIKHGLCDCPRLIEMLDSHVSYRDLLREVILHKISIMEQDPREINKGFMLIYGHTVGHALEILSEGRLLHGEAIALGMVVEATISFYLGCCSKHLISYHKELFCKYNLPVTIPEYINENDIIDKLSYDKKERKQHMRFPLLKDIGEMVCNADNYTHEVPMSIIRKAIVANMKI